MRIFHCNFVYPLLSEKARLILQEEREIFPRTAFAADGLENMTFFHDVRRRLKTQFGRMKLRPYASLWESNQ